MSLFKRTPKAATYANLPAPLNALSPAAKKRREDETIMQRRICDPVEAHPNDKIRRGIDSWDFVTPGDSEEEQELVDKICKKCYRETADDTGDGEEEGVILRAGFSEEEPATYKWFIAEYGTREELTGLSYGAERYFGTADSSIEALRMLAHYICDQRDRMR